ncbi:hypothetical protein GS506_00795 [Rhodococcus hoagii]|nr:hypothetical protein [Prescottella equi]
MNRFCCSSCRQVPCSAGFGVEGSPSPATLTVSGPSPRLCDQHNRVQAWNRRV